MIGLSPISISMFTILLFHVESIKLVNYMSLFALFIARKTWRHRPWFYVVKSHVQER